MSDEEKKKFRIGRSGPGRGFGLFSRVSYKKGEFVVEYTGTKISSKIADDLTTRYLFEIDEQWTIDGSPRTNIARYINHSCEPNCEVEIEDGRIMLYAVRAISAGEELTFDYGEEYFDEFIKPIGCKCSKCSKYGTENRETVRANESVV